VILAALSAVLCTLAGCSGQSSFLTGGPTVGQLKASVSHLEYENEQMRKSTAKLERENRSMEDRLVQEQMENGDLTARLDDARNLLRDRGLEADVRVGSHRGGTTLGGSTSEGEGDLRSSLPDGSRTRRRRTPFAQISGGSDSVAPIEVDDPAADPQPRVRPRARTKSSGRQLDDELGDQSSHKPPQSWTRVAESSDDSMIQIR
jgi:outer membrane murein-binding lipoprotein Lpp